LWEQQAQIFVDAQQMADTLKLVAAGANGLALAIASQCSATACFKWF